MISNESGKPVLFVRPDQQRSCPAFWIVITSTCLDHKAAAQSSATSNINQPFISSIHVLQRRFVLRMKDQSLFYQTELASSVPEQLSEKYRPHTITTSQWLIDYTAYDTTIPIHSPPTFRHMTYWGSEGLRKALTAWNTNTFTNFSDLLRIFPTYLAFPDIPCRDWNMWREYYPQKQCHAHYLAI